jgi:hypothetical protein
MISLSVIRLVKDERDGLVPQSRVVGGAAQACVRTIPQVRGASAMPPDAHEN